MPQKEDIGQIPGIAMVTKQVNEGLTSVLKCKLREQQPSKPHFADKRRTERQ